MNHRIYYTCVVSIFSFVSQQQREISNFLFSLMTKIKCYNFKCVPGLTSSTLHKRDELEGNFPSLNFCRRLVTSHISRRGRDKRLKGTWLKSSVTPRQTHQSRCLKGRRRGYETGGRIRNDVCVSPLESER